MSLLLQYTKKKLDALLRTIEAIKELEFPHNDAAGVLTIVENSFSILRDELKLGPSNYATIKAWCQRVLEQIENYLPIVGYIVRSTDLDGPVELQGPLLRLTHKALGHEAKLIIFSEWNYSPFTIVFPELMKQSVVLVGMPSSEANNALIAPLAGHELGHNVWFRENYADKIGDLAEKIILEEINKDWKKWKKVFELKTPNQLESLKGYEVWDTPWQWTLRQCEEIFSDLIGLLLFHEAYLHAFQYLLAPGHTKRYDYNYPDLNQRAMILASCAQRVPIQVSPDYVSSFEIGTGISDDERGILADVTTARLVDHLFSLADDFIKRVGLSLSLRADIDNAYAALVHVVPATNTNGIASIVNAAWRLSLEDGNFFTKIYPRADPSEKDVVLNELVLKSFEVYEIERRVAE